MKTTLIKLDVSNRENLVYTFDYNYASDSESVSKFKSVGYIEVSKDDIESLISALESIKYNCFEK